VPERRPHGAVLRGRLIVDHLPSGFDDGCVPPGGCLALLGSSYRSTRLWPVSATNTAPRTDTITVTQHGNRGATAQLHVATTQLNISPSPIVAGPTAASTVTGSGFGQNELVDVSFTAALSSGGTGTVIAAPPASTGRVPRGRGAPSRATTRRSPVPHASPGWRAPARDRRASTRRPPRMR